jgi:hypothetical protein
MLVNRMSGINFSWDSRTQDRIVISYEQSTQNRFTVRALTSLTPLQRFFNYFMHNYIQVFIPSQTGGRDFYINVNSLRKRTIEHFINSLPHNLSPQEKKQLSSKENGKITNNLNELRTISLNREKLDKIKSIAQKAFPEPNRASQGEFYQTTYPTGSSRRGGPTPVPQESKEETARRKMHANYTLERMSELIRQLSNASVVIDLSQVITHQKNINAYLKTFEPGLVGLPEEDPEYKGMAVRLRDAITAYLDRPDKSRSDRPAAGSSSHRPAAGSSVVKLDTEIKSFKTLQELQTFKRTLMHQRGTLLQILGCDEEKEQSILRKLSRLVHPDSMRIPELTPTETDEFKRLASEIFNYIQRKME